MKNNHRYYLKGKNKNKNKNKIIIIIIKFFKNILLPLKKNHKLHLMGLKPIRTWSDEFITIIIIIIIIIYIFEKNIITIKEKS